MQDLRRQKDKEVALLQKKWKRTLKELDYIYEQLKIYNNLRIHDPETGGVLRGDVSSRKANKELWEEQIKFVSLLCSEENLNTEIGYSRALFNNKYIKIENKKNGDIQRMNLVAYEAPVVRKKSNKLNRDINSRFAQCDLIGQYNNYMIAIEVKIEPEKYGTYLPQALVESFAYGYFLNYHIQSDNTPLFKSEINLCLEQFHPNLNIQTHDSYQIEYIVAAPREYFMVYFTGNNKSQEWYKRRRIETRKIEELIFNKEPSFPKFGGYLVINKSHDDVIDQFNLKSKNCLPMFDTPLTVAALYPDFSALESDLS